MSAATTGRSFACLSGAKPLSALCMPLLQAEARQAKFDSSAVGRAARKAVDNVKKEREADAAAASNKDNSRDWLT